MQTFLAAYGDITDKLYTRQPRYFRRVRLPPLLFIFWNNITINQTMAALETDRIDSDMQDQITQLYALGKKLRIRDIEYITDTLTLLTQAKLALHGTNSSVDSFYRQYRKRYPAAYTLRIEPLTRGRWQRSVLHLLFPLLLRKNPNYRLFDVPLLIGPIPYAIRKLSSRFSPSFATKQTMSIGTIFR
jgi:hypothetical protein